MSTLYSPMKEALGKLNVALLRGMVVKHTHGGSYVHFAQNALHVPCVAQPI